MERGHQEEYEHCPKTSTAEDQERCMNSEYVESTKRYRSPSTDLDRDISPSTDEPERKVHLEAFLRATLEEQDAYIRSGKLELVKRSASPTPERSSSPQSVYRIGEEIPASAFRGHTLPNRAQSLGGSGDGEEQGDIGLFGLGIDSSEEPPRGRSLARRDRSNSS